MYLVHTPRRAAQRGCPSATVKKKKKKKTGPGQSRRWDQASGARPGSRINQTTVQYSSHRILKVVWIIHMYVAAEQSESLLIELIGSAAQMAANRPHGAGAALGMGGGMVQYLEQ